MRYQGKIAAWNDARGFGFIDWNGGNDRVFVHISAFPAQSRKPSIGDIVTYEVLKDEKGQFKAFNVVFTRFSIEPAPSRQSHSWRPLLRLAAIIALVAIGCMAFMKKASESVSASESLLAAEPLQDQTFRCEGKTHCTHMSSCAEATFYQQNCPGTEMDGDGDGVLCESQWCP
ncbi:MAG: cold shock domain-containing protein [Pseudomonadota bacterium]